jgi:hypothetical protein
MANVSRDHIDVDTRPYPIVRESFYGTASDVVLETATNRPSDSNVASGGNSHAEILAISIPMTTYSTVAASSQRVQSLIPVQSMKSTMAGKATTMSELSIGTIFAIVLGSITGLSLTIILLARYLERFKQRRIQTKEDDVILKHVTSHRKLDERALDVGFQRLHRASIRRWSDKEAVV